MVYAGISESDLSNSNVIEGTNAEDLIFGGAGDDSLMGFADDDVLAGSDGNDTLSDGAGEDLLSGGSGSDIFVLDTDGVTDTIVDFEQGVDLIDLSSWVVATFNDLSVVTTASGSTVSYGLEVLNVEVVGSSGSLISGDFVL